MISKKVLQVLQVLQDRKKLVMKGIIFVTLFKKFGYKCYKLGNIGNKIGGNN